jgi:hypothetical protein
MEVLNNTSMLWRIWHIPLKDMAYPSEGYGISFRGTVSARVQYQTLLIPIVLESDRMIWTWDHIILSKNTGPDQVFPIICSLKIYLKNRVGYAYLRFSSVCVPIHVFLLISWKWPWILFSFNMFYAVFVWWYAYTGLFQYGSSPFM